MVEMSPVPDNPARIHARNLVPPPPVSTGSLACAKDEHDYVFCEKATVHLVDAFYSSAVYVQSLWFYYRGAILRTFYFLSQFVTLEAIQPCAFSLLLCLAWWHCIHFSVVFVMLHWCMMHTICAMYSNSYTYHPIFWWLEKSIFILPILLYIIPSYSFWKKFASRWRWSVDPVV